MLRDLPAYLILRLVLGVFAMLPPRTASNFGSFIAQKLGPLTRFHTIAKRNLDMCLPHTDHAEILALMWDNLGRNLGEHPHMHICADWAELIDDHNILGQFRQTGGVLASAHLANWEISVPVIQHKAGIHMHAAYRAPNNTLVDAYLQHEREKSGAAKTISKTRRGAIEMIRALKNNQTIGVLVDQKDNTGEPLYFFGQPANSTITYVAMARSAEKPLALLLMHRKPNAFGYVYTVEPVLTDNLTDTQIAQNITARIEHHIRAHPSQFLWIHRRFDKSLYAADSKLSN